MRRDFAYSSVSVILLGLLSGCFAAAASTGRGEAALPPVTRNTSLERIADDYACRMIAEDFFGHTDPITGHGPGDRAVVGKYSFYAIGENLAAGQETAAEVMKVWMDSPSHRDIILDEKWSEVGISVRAG